MKKKISLGKIYMLIGNLLSPLSKNIIALKHWNSLIAYAQSTDWFLLELNVANINYNVPHHKQSIVVSLFPHDVCHSKVFHLCKSKWGRQGVLYTPNS